MKKSLFSIIAVILTAIISYGQDAQLQQFTRGGKTVVINLATVYSAFPKGDSSTYLNYTFSGRDLVSDNYFDVLDDNCGYLIEVHPVGVSLPTGFTTIGVNPAFITEVTPSGSGSYIKMSSPKVGYTVTEAPNYFRNTVIGILCGGAGTGGVDSIATNLAYTASATQGIVTSSTGTDATVPAVTGTNAGLSLPAHKAKLDFMSITQAVNLDLVEAGAIDSIAAHRTDINNLQALSGRPDGSTNNGTYTGSTISDNQNTKQNIQQLETAVEGKLGTTLNSAQVFVGNSSNVATARTLSGDATISNTGVVTVTKQDRIMFMDESSTLGTIGTADTLKFVGAGVTATRSGGTVTATISGGVSGIDTLTSVDQSILITDLGGGNVDINVDIAQVKPFIIDTSYAVTISGGNAGSHLGVTADGLGITCSFASGVYTLTVPAGVHLKSVHLLIVAADVQAGTDGSVTDWIRVVLPTKENTNLTNPRFPIVQKTAIPNSGALAVGNAASRDGDNDPAVDFTGISSSTVTCRVSGLSPDGQGYSLTFSGF